MAEEKRGFTGSEAQQTARGEKLHGDVEQPVSAAEIAKSFSGIDYPASKVDLIKHAEGKGVRDHVLRRIETMVEKQYQSMADVEHEFSQAKKREPNT
jgi:hypothetical protein